MTKINVYKKMKRKGLYQYSVNNGSGCYVGLVKDSGHVMFYICLGWKGRACPRLAGLLAQGIAEVQGVFQCHRRDSQNLHFNLKRCSS